MGTASTVVSLWDSADCRHNAGTSVRYSKDLQECVGFFPKKRYTVDIWCALEYMYVTHEHNNARSYHAHYARKRYTMENSLSET